MSWQEQLRAEGELRGRAEAEARGRRTEQRRIFLSLLRQRFGEPSAEVMARVDAASTELLSAWTDRFFAATSVDELLCDG